MDKDYTNKYNNTKKSLESLSRELNILNKRVILTTLEILLLMPAQRI